MTKKLLSDILRLSLKQAAVASAAIAVVSAVVLAFVYFSGTTVNIKDSPTVASLKQKVEKYPANKELVDRFREVDFQERARFFGKTAFLDAGVDICLGFFILSLIFFRVSTLLTERIPEVKKGSEVGFSAFRGTGKDIALFSSVITALIVISAFLLLSALGLGRFPWQAKETSAAKAKISVDLTQEWPGFRGFTGQGVVNSGEYPVEWDLKTGKNISWKIDLPVKAYSSPIVLGDSLFITGSGEKKLKLLSLSASKGNINWSSTVMAKTNTDDIEVMSEEAGGAGYASPTPVTDGEYVYVYFATNVLACFDLAGKQQWSKFFGKPENTYGLSSSPVLFEDKVIVQVDQSGEETCRIYAVNKASGEIVWETKRPDGATWSTPIIIDHKGRTELITTGSPWVISYDPKTGSELWKVDCLVGEISTSAVYADEKVYVMSVGSQTTVFAITPGGMGDVTKINIVWKYEEDNQAINAPVALQSKLIVAMNGSVVCHDTATGKVLWQHKMEDDFWASPAAAGNTIYIPSQKGKVYIFDLEGKLVNTMDIGEKLSASTAHAGGGLYIRTDKMLFCVRDEKNK